MGLFAKWVFGSKGIAEQNTVMLKILREREAADPDARRIPRTMAEMGLSPQTGLPSFVPYDRSYQGLRQTPLISTGITLLEKLQAFISFVLKFHQQGKREAE